MSEAARNNKNSYWYLFMILLKLMEWYTYNKHCANIHLLVTYQLPAIPEGQTIWGEHYKVCHSYTSSRYHTFLNPSFLRQHQMAAVPVKKIQWQGLQRHWESCHNLRRFKTRRQANLSNYHVICIDINNNKCCVICGMPSLNTGTA